MKRSLLIAGLATLGTSAVMAQSTVTIYGRLNVTLERQKIAGDWFNEVVNNSSRIGFRGSEDLGGGLKAGFQIEHGFNPDTGTATGGPTAPFWARQSELFLGGGFGTVRLGRFTSEAYYATADYVSMHNHDTGTSADVFYAYAGRNNDKVGYMSPNYGGLVFHASVSATDAGGADRNYDLAANWDSGPLHLGAGFERGDGDARQFAVRALYDLGPFTVGGYVQRDKDVYAAGNRTTLRLAGMYKMGNGEFHLNWGRAGSYSGVAGDEAANQFTVAYNHNLSKRTKVYAFYTRVDADGAIPTYGGDFDSIAVGIRHNF